LRIAFIDVVETGAKDKKATYYSKLVKVDKNDPTGKDQVIRAFLLSDEISQVSVSAIRLSLTWNPSLASMDNNTY
jgi:hypothetical protein